uniref:Uncharacterized protein n=1 Tax=Manihot esculenta TaxID=3983 RepID=A0A251KHK8_MANES
MLKLLNPDHSGVTMVTALGWQQQPLLEQNHNHSDCSESKGQTRLYYGKCELPKGDGLACFSSYHLGNCCASKTMCELDSEDRLIQFLMGLNDNYDHMRNRILLMDILPSNNKARSMVLRVEK